MKTNRAMGKRKFALRAFGLRPNESVVLKSVCLLSGHGARACGHELAPEGSPVDIYVVDATDPQAVERWRTADPTAARPVVLVGEGVPGPMRGATLQRPLLASRLLATLDQIAQTEQRAGPATLLPVMGVLPPAVPQARPAQSAPSATPPAPAVPARGAVLVVDDSPTVRKHLDLVLRDAGLETVSVATGEAALDEISQREFVLVLLDVVLPGSDGYHVCKTIKKSFGARLPVVMLTSRSSPFDRIRGSLAGCDAYLVKPVDKVAFMNTLNKYLAVNGGAPAAVRPVQPVSG